MIMSAIASVAIAIGAAAAQTLRMRDLELIFTGALTLFLLNAVGRMRIMMRSADALRAAPGPRGRTRFNFAATKNGGKTGAERIWFCRRH